MSTTTETTEPDLITEVETLLNDVGFSGDFETVSRPLLRRLVEEVKTWQRYYESAVADFAVEMNTVREQLAQLRGALEPLSQNGRLFTFHRNVAEGDYFECGICHQEAKQWNGIRHTPTCRIEIAKKALEATA